MAFVVQWQAPEALVSYLTTDLNSITNGSFSASGAEINNENDKKQYINLELNLATQGVARSNGANVEIWIEAAVDNTPTYPDRAVADLTSALVTAFQFDATTTARRVTLFNIPIPPLKFKLYVRNLTGQTLAASGNTLKYRRHNEEAV